LPEEKEKTMSQTIDQDADHPVNPTFDPLDPDYLSDPYPYFTRARLSFRTATVLAQASTQRRTLEKYFYDLRTY
jgi:hypothetical protein